MGSSDHSDARSPVRETFFAHAGRATTAELQELVRVSAHPFVHCLLDALQGLVMVLDQHRQLVAANAELTEALARDGAECTVGLRPGELFNCVHFTEGPDGCTTSAHCRSCGAAIALSSAQSTGAPAVAECRLAFVRDGAMCVRDFHVRACSFELEGHPLLVAVLEDVSAAKRRDVLERVFLHDVLNTIGGIEGWVALLQREGPSAAAGEILVLSNQLENEVEFQQRLLQAQDGRLEVRAQPTTSGRVLTELESLFRGHSAAQGKHLDVQLPSPDVPLATDRHLLMRVLGNMVKNALEATPQGGTVRVSVAIDQAGALVFSVHNCGTIPDEVIPHLFERSFSTKQPAGRGLGTYSMKMFGESYLGGKVTFHTDARDGTIFSIALPPTSPTLADRAARPSCRVTTEPEPRAAGRSRRGRVLYVDDHPALLRLGRHLLEQHGYAVTSCSGGRCALEHFLANPSAFDVVITDLAMPDVSGLDLARAVHTERPSLPIIVTTGLLDTPDEDALHALGIQAFLHKPITAEDTLATLANVLQPLA